jgi:hypothetical protein
MALRFEWDEKKAAANLRKHGMSFGEASTVFYDPSASIFDDEAHLEEPIHLLLKAASRVELIPQNPFHETA